MTRGDVTRRQALKTAASFMIVPAGLVRGYQANETPDIGVIGLAGMGVKDARGVRDAGANIAALCDVDSTFLDMRAAEFPKAKKYGDFRKMIEAEKLDGVVVATPDHTHAYISVYAMKHGLHVYCEKPLTQTAREARVMTRVASEMKVVTQMGTQSSASPGVMRTVELIQSGALGEITEIHLATDRPIWPQGYERLPGEDAVPATLNWDVFLGPAPVRPYRAMYPTGHAVYGPKKKKQSEFEIAGLEPVPPLGVVYHPFVWRGWIDFGSGALGDIAPHAMNVIFWALDLDAPSAVEVVETSGMTKEMFPDWSVLRFDWPRRGVHPPLSIYWYDGGKTPPKEITGGKGGMVWIGTKGSLPQGRGPFAGERTEPYAVPEPRDWNRKSVHSDWVVAIKAGKQAPCHFGYAGPFTESYQLGNIALRVGHRVEWDPLAFRITNCREANQYLHREDRRGWEIAKIAGSAWKV
ncbi:MAG: Gfo/Idh/MocA family oxidoreductase [bacterium]|nr:Gfo/Idh/MocA family oxidoreductase [bacterium]